MNEYIKGDFNLSNENIEKTVPITELKDILFHNNILKDINKLKKENHINKEIRFLNHLNEIFVEKIKNLLIDKDNIILENDLNDFMALTIKERYEKKTLPYKNLKELLQSFNENININYLKEKMENLINKINFFFFFIEKKFYLNFNQEILNEDNKNKIQENEINKNVINKNVINKNIINKNIINENIINENEKIIKNNTLNNLYNKNEPINNIDILKENKKSYKEIEEKLNKENISNYIEKTFNINVTKEEENEFDKYINNLCNDLTPKNDKYNKSSISNENIKIKKVFKINEIDNNIQKNNLIKDNIKNEIFIKNEENNENINQILSKEINKINSIEKDPLSINFDKNKNTYFIDNKLNNTDIFVSNKTDISYSDINNENLNTSTTLMLDDSNKKNEKNDIYIHSYNVLDDLKNEDKNSSLYELNNSNNLNINEKNVKKDNNKELFYSNKEEKKLDNVNLYDDLILSLNFEEDDKNLNTYIDDNNINENTFDNDYSYNNVDIFLSTKNNEKNINKEVIENDIFLNDLNNENEKLNDVKYTEEIHQNINEHEHEHEHEHISYIIDEENEDEYRTNYIYRTDDVNRKIFEENSKEKLQSNIFLGNEKNNSRLKKWLNKMTARELERKKKIEKRKEEANKKELNECTFHPTVLCYKNKMAIMKEGLYNEYDKKSSNDMKYNIYNNDIKLYEKKNSFVFNKFFDNIENYPNDKYNEKNKEEPLHLNDGYSLTSNKRNNKTNYIKLTKNTSNDKLTYMKNEHNIFQNENVEKYNKKNEIKKKVENDFLNRNELLYMKALKRNENLKNKRNHLKKITDEKFKKECTFHPLTNRNKEITSSDIPKGYFETIERIKKAVKERNRLNDFYANRIPNSMKNTQKNIQNKIQPFSFDKGLYKVKIKPVFFETKIKISENKIASLAIREDEDPLYIVDIFCKIHAIKNEDKKVLYAYILDELKKKFLNE